MLVFVYLYLALFAIACFAGWYITGSEPTALIAGVFGAAGIESIVAGIIKWNETNTEKELREKELNGYMPPKGE